MKKFIPMLLAAMLLMTGCNSDSGTNSDAGDLTAGYSLSGTIRDSSGKAISGITVTLAGGSTSAQLTSTTTDTNGTYTFTGLSNGLYVITGVPLGYSFTPAYRTVTILLLSQTGLDFVGVAGSGTTTGHTVSGAVKTSAGAGISGVTVALTSTNSTPATATTGADGSYSFANVADGAYFVTPVKTNYLFNPVYSNVTVSGANQTGFDFIGAVSQNSAAK